MRWLMVLGGLAVVAVGVLIALVLFEDQSPPEPATVQAGPPIAAPAEDRRPPTRRPPPRPRPGRPDGGLAGAAAARPPERPVDESSVQHFGQEFERKWYADRERLGAERHRQMEELWFEGRRPRGDPAAIEKLERLLADYPDTNRAGCAAMELGHHYLRDRQLDMRARREKATEYWRLAEERYGDSLCEYNAPVGGLSKLALATWVYRQSDPGMARRLLEEIIAKHQGETDHLGRPLAATARQLLEQLR